MSETKTPIDPDRAIPPGMTKSQYWATCIWEFLLAWFGSRPYRKLLVGLPAVILGCGVLAGVIARPFYTVGKRTIHYRIAARKAIEEDEIPVAMMCLEKLWEMDPENHPALFSLALQLNQLPEADASTVEYLYRLAPEHEAVYGPAHRWVAEVLFQSASADQLPTVLPKIKTHLEHADAVAKRDFASNYLWYLYYGNADEPEKAIACLAAAAEEQPSLAFQNLMVAQQGNQSDEFVRKAAIASDRFLTRQISAGSAPRQQYLQHAIVLEILERPDRLLELAAATVEKFPDDELARGFLAGRLRRQLANMNADEASDIPLMVKTALTLWDAQQDIALAELDTLAKSKTKSRHTRQFLRRLLEQHDATGAIAESLAGLAAQRQDLDSAERLFEVSLRQDPDSSPALNNLAWVLQRKGNTDQLPRALDLINRALLADPEEPVFRETRGQILTKLKRWAPAVQDLKFALNKLPDSAETHAALATALRGLGKTDLAEFHEQQALRLD